jgi:hypothetical protein
VILLEQLPTCLCEDSHFSSFSVLPAKVFQSSITNEGDNINSVNSDVVIHIDESGDACLNASICTSSGGHDNGICFTSKFAHIIARDRSRISSHQLLTFVIIYFLERTKTGNIKRL